MSQREAPVPSSGPDVDGALRSLSCLRMLYSEELMQLRCAAVQASDMPTPVKPTTATAAVPQLRGRKALRADAPAAAALFFADVLGLVRRVDLAELQPALAESRELQLASARNSFAMIVCRRQLLKFLATWPAAECFCHRCGKGPYGASADACAMCGTVLQRPTKNYADSRLVQEFDEQCARRRHALLEAKKDVAVRMRRLLMGEAQSRPPSASSVASSSTSRSASAAARSSSGRRRAMRSAAGGSHTAARALSLNRATLRPQLPSLHASPDTMVVGRSLQQ